MKVYKLVRQLKDGSLRPLFIGKTKPFVIGQKMHCEYLPTKGFAPRSVDDSQTGGWHCCFQPVAPHLDETLKTGETRVWLECEAEGTTKTYHRGEHQGGDWILAEIITPIRVMPWDEVRKMQAAYHGINIEDAIEKVDHYVYRELGYTSDETNDIIALNDDLIRKLIAEGKTPEEIAGELDYSTVSDYENYDDNEEPNQ